MMLSTTCEESLLEIITVELRKILSPGIPALVRHICTGVDTYPADRTIYRDPISDPETDNSSPLLLSVRISGGDAMRVGVLLWTARSWQDILLPIRRELRRILRPACIPSGHCQPRVLRRVHRPCAPARASTARPMRTFPPRVCCGSGTQRPL